jgi:low affinity Fe/Cu permease
MRERLDRLCTAVTNLAGSVWALPSAFIVVLAWFVCGFFFGFGNTLYQLVINTGTTIVTFLMIFGVQRVQNKDVAEIKAMLKELVEDIAEVDEERAARRAEEAQA